MWRVTQRGCCGWLTDVAQPFPVSSSESWPFRPHQSRVAGTQTKHASIACFDCVARSAFPPFPRPSSLLVHFLIPTSLLVPPGAPRSLCSPRHHPPRPRACRSTHSSTGATKQYRRIAYRFPNSSMVPFHSPISARSCQPPRRRRHIDFQPQRRIQQLPSLGASLRGQCSKASENASPSQSPCRRHGMIPYPNRRRR
jgi:hypothetical protein